LSHIIGDILIGDGREGRGTGPELKLGLSGFTYADFYHPARLEALDEAFRVSLARADGDLAREFAQYRATRGADLSAREESNLLVRVAPHLGSFIARLFGVEGECEEMRARAEAEAVIFEFKKMCVLRRVRNLAAEEVLAAVAEFQTLDARVREWRETRLTAAGQSADDELVAARLWRALEAEEREVFARWLAALGVVAPHQVRDWVSWRIPHPLDYAQLVPHERPREDLPELLTGLAHTQRRRDGFTLTDPRMNPREVLDEIHYCLYCHERDKDSCADGFHEPDGSVRLNPLGIPLEGCPLDEKISEAHLVRRAGEALGALALVMIDNPLCPGTGHRICNDCMKSCIFQKQEPVNIPQIETGILTDVLRLPWGVEIYGLLTRWNPLHVHRPHALPYNGRNVLVVGLGPAGYTLAHYLLNEGFGVVAIDGLKIEPLPPELAGAPFPRPIRDWSEMYRSLDTRVLEGFGGVSEYGITVRWDKNFLTLLHLTLARRAHLRIYDGVRFGGTLTIEDAWERGFDHLAIATGAGRPTIVGMKNNLIGGIRQASDFLMALQLTGAFKETALANLQVQLPALVIGGGLTAIDTATELAAYYPAQVEKMLDRSERLIAEQGEEKFWQVFNQDERAILERFIEHGREVRSERARAAACGEAPDLARLVRSWGGVSIVYRKTLQDSPAYRLNHEEVIKALEEGINIIECLNPVEAVKDESGSVAAMRFVRQRLEADGKWIATGEEVELPARAVAVAAGTSPNVIYEREMPGTFRLDRRGQFFQPHRLLENGARRLEMAAKDEVGFFTSYERDGRYITYYGDNHPVFAGNVVKAMASAKHGYREIVRLFADELARLDPATQDAREEQFRAFVARLDEELIARVERVERLTPTIIEVVVRAPLAARKFRPGQFYRLQNYETSAPEMGGTRLLMEGIALTGAWCDVERGLLSLIVLEMGTSSRLCARLTPGERVVVMGPTGAPTEIPEG
jgi:NADPH-dependent glutamate synthase beta subunit-like oxidoreductase